MLDRILRREHEERFGQLIRLAGRGHAVLLHRLEQRGLRLRRGAVDFVGEHDAGENRARLELEDALSGAVLFLEQLRAGDVARHEIGRELDARERKFERLRERLDEQRLREAGHADQDDVAAGEDRADETLHDLVLAHDATADLRGKLALRLLQRVEQLEVLFARC